MKSAACLENARLFGMETQSNALAQPCAYFRLLFALYLGMSRYDRPSHRVYMSFFFRSGWQVQFLEADLKTPLPRKLMFTDPRAGQAR